VAGWEPTLGPLDDGAGLGLTWMAGWLVWPPPPMFGNSMIQLMQCLNWSFASQTLGLIDAGKKL